MRFMLASAACIIGHAAIAHAEEATQPPVNTTPALAETAGAPQGRGEQFGVYSQFEGRTQTTFLIDWHYTNGARRLDLESEGDDWEGFEGNHGGFSLAFPIAFGFGVQWDRYVGADDVKASSNADLFVSDPNVLQRAEVGERFFDLFDDENIEQSGYSNQLHVFRRAPGAYAWSLSINDVSAETETSRVDADSVLFGFEMDFYRGKRTYGFNAAFGSLSGDEFTVSLESGKFFNNQTEMFETRDFVRLTLTDDNADDGFALGAEANASYFPTPFVRFTGRGSLVQYQSGDIALSQDATAARVAGEAEYKIPRSPLHFTAGAAATLSTSRSFSTDAGDASIAAYVGLRLVFGPDNLVEFDRRGAAFEGSNFLIDTLFER